MSPFAKLIRRKKRKTIVFADISGSSALYKQHGNLTAKTIIDSQLAAMSSLIEQAGGKVVKTIGDEVMASFNDVDQCFDTAITLQRTFSHNALEKPLQLSIGMSYGEVLHDKGDLFGDAVNDAAHLTHEAQRGQILISASVWSQISSDRQMMAREFDQIKFKGADESSTIYRIFWQSEESSDSETLLMSGKLVSERLNIANLIIKYGSQAFSLSPSQTPFIIGRDNSRCNLLIEGTQVSRAHCKVDFHRGKFVLIDHSTNGCYLRAEGKQEFYIRRGEYPLLETVELSLGLPIEDSERETIKLEY